MSRRPRRRPLSHDTKSERSGGTRVSRRGMNGGMNDMNGGMNEGEASPYDTCIDGRATFDERPAPASMSASPQSGRTGF